MDKNKLRKECIRLIKTYGSSQSFIAKKCGTTRAVINFFLNHKRELPNDISVELNNWLNSLNYKNKESV